MKKISLLLCLAFIICSISGCGKNTSPDDIAYTYLNAAANFDYDGMDSVSVISYQDLYESIIKSLAEKQDKTEAEIFEQVSKLYEFENKVSNVSEYIAEFQKYQKNKFKNSYGEDASIDVSIINISDLSEDDKSKMLSEASDYYDSQGVIISDIINFAKINQCKKVKSKVYYRSSNGKKDETENLTIYLIEINKKWKVLNLG